MAKKRGFNVEGLDDLIDKLDGLSKNTYSVMKATLYPGAGILADEIRRRCPDPDVAAGVDIVRMTAQGGKVDTAIVFTGYDKNGVARALRAAIYESGTSDRFTKKGHLYRGGITKKIKFISGAVKAIRERVTEIMRYELTKRMKESMED